MRVLCDVREGRDVSRPYKNLPFFRIILHFPMDCHTSFDGLPRT